MLQPVLVLMEVNEDSRRSELAEEVENGLREAGWNVAWAIPMAYTLDVPKGAVSG